VVLQVLPLNLPGQIPNIHSSSTNNTTATAKSTTSVHYSTSTPKSSSTATSESSSSSRILAIFSDKNQSPEQVRVIKFSNRSLSILKNENRIRLGKLYI
jgi:NADH:ubiquinone oxidoreductase subunit D